MVGVEEGPFGHQLWWDVHLQIWKHYCLEGARPFFLMMWTILLLRHRYDQASVALVPVEPVCHRLYRFEMVIFS